MNDLTSEEFELKESGRHVPPVVAEKMPLFHPSVLNETPRSMSVPASLCDEELIREIASIPDKMGFKIGDVAEMLGIKQYVLRYWESEFDCLKPKKAANNQRYYTRKDVENAYIIRKLLHRDKFSIEGARHAMKEVKTGVKKEREWNQFVDRIDTLEERVDDLILDLRRLKQLFA